MGICYVNGAGVAENYIEAYKWIYLAADQGSEVAKQKLPLLEKEMSPEQIAKGKESAADFKRRNE